MAEFDRSSFINKYREAGILDEALETAADLMELQLDNSLEVRAKFSNGVEILGQVIANFEGMSRVAQIIELEEFVGKLLEKYDGFDELIRPELREVLGIKITDE